MHQLSTDTIPKKSVYENTGLSVSVKKCPKDFRPYSNKTVSTANGGKRKEKSLILIDTPVKKA